MRNSKKSLLVSIMYSLSVIIIKLDKVIAEMQVANSRQNTNHDGLFNIMQNWSDQAANDEPKGGLNIVAAIIDDPHAPHRSQTELPSEPDWSKAPDWAKWFAIDADGEGYWFEHKPSIHTVYWGECTDGGDVELVGMFFDHSDWKNSLRQRPKTELGGRL